MLLLVARLPRVQHRNREHQGFHNPSANQLQGKHKDKAHPLVVQPLSPEPPRKLLLRRPMQRVRQHRPQNPRLPQPPEEEAHLAQREQAALPRASTD